eukprot:CAMPEP_0194307650 /NCGR_PEP_ID=MMETSP0171-20130528/4548_1 /TAXON_ID=218684 /ORGANISM="Corethron pennatum, Strain L29A3" /LENGTH=48 /DNA_ID= /DNA_START= /DNA_END= /DNA_ORIENTATION=
MTSPPSAPATMVPPPPLPPLPPLPAHRNSRRPACNPTAPTRVPSPALA